MKVKKDLLPVWFLDKKFLTDQSWEKRRRKLSLILRVIQRLLFFFPVKKNRIMIYTHERKGFSCNPKYVARKLKEMYDDQVEIIWVTTYPDTCASLRDMGILVVKTNSKLHVSKYMRTRVYVTNDGFPPWALHRPNQRWINLWHGGMNYKHIGYKHLEPMSRTGFHLYQLQNRRPDVFFAGSKAFKQDTAHSFDLPEEVFWETGMSRNDIFFEEHAHVKQDIMEQYGLVPEHKIVLYAPTFRHTMEDSTYGLDFEGLTEALKSRFGGSWTVFFRNHNFVKSEKREHGNVVDVSDYEDMQELLYISDVLISDYSSCMWDFCLTGRPCFVYANDVSEYTTGDRTLSYPMEKWPYPIAATNEQLEACITAFDEKEYKSRIQKHLHDLGSYDKGNAAEQVAVLIGSYCFGER